jgi:hypothetical protein
MFVDTVMSNSSRLAFGKAAGHFHVWKGVKLKIYVTSVWRSDFGERACYYLSWVDRVRRIRDRKQRMDIGKYSFVNRTIKNWNQLPAEALGTFPCKPQIFRQKRKAVISGMKRKE